MNKKRNIKKYIETVYYKMHLKFNFSELFELKYFNDKTYDGRAEFTNNRKYFVRLSKKFCKELKNADCFFERRKIVLALKYILAHEFAHILCVDVTSEVRKSQRRVVISSELHPVDTAIQIVRELRADIIGCAKSGLTSKQIERAQQTVQGSLHKQFLDRANCYKSGYASRRDRIYYSQMYQCFEPYVVESIIRNVIKDFCTTMKIANVNDIKEAVRNEFM